jgi:transposase
MQTLPVLDGKACGIDVGSEQLHVSIGGDTPKVFGTATGQLHALREWLKEEGVKSVAMEATGVYWLCAYEVLETAGLEVLVVNGKHVKNLPGRKTDLKDCQWLATLHAHGLLRSGFVPPEHIRRLQDYLRLRADHVTLAASHIQHLQKALERMNVKLHDVISSVVGVSGLRIIRAILAGQRDTGKLLELCDGQIQKKKAEAVKESLRGTWKAEHLFALKHGLEAWEFYQQKIAECDREIERVLQDLAGPETKPQSKGKPGGPNTPQIENLHGLLMRLCGDKDVTVLPGLADHTLLSLIGEVGTDLSRWKTDKHFTAWCGLPPGSRQSGKRRGVTSRQRNRAGRLFCVMARSVGRTVDKALGGFYRRLKARRGGLVANQALARKLAALFWRLMVHGQDYVEQGLKKYESRVEETQKSWLRKLAKKHGLVLVSPPPSTAEVHG